MPIQSNALHPFNISKEEERLVNLEVQNLLAKAAMEICSPAPNQFISNIFTIPKKDDREKASGRHVRTESVCGVSSIQDGGYIATERYPPERGLHDKAGSSRCLLDYYSKCKIKDLFKIFWKGMLYQFTCLPLSLSPSARLFTKTLKPVIAFLRSMRIRLLIFLDDILIMADSLERPAEHTEKIVIRVLESLGFMIKKRSQS